MLRTRTVSSWRLGQYTKPLYNAHGIWIQAGNALLDMAVRN